MSVDRQRIVNEVLSGYGKPIYGPVPEGLAGDGNNEDIFNMGEAKSVLQKAGWSQNASTSIWEKKISKNKCFEVLLCYL